MLTGNLNLFFRDVATNLNQFHTVEQWPRYRVQIISSSNKHHFRQVIIHIEEVVMKRCILFRIKHFQ